MTKPKVTIITVAFNAESTIEETILSVLRQDYDNLEYLIIDGASKDNTLSIAEKYTTPQPGLKHTISKIISEPDDGLYDAMNKGVMLASGQWVNFMNCGDRFVNGSVVSRMFSSPSDRLANVSIIYGDTELIKDGNLTIEKGDTPFSTHRHQPFAHQSAFFSTADKHLITFNHKKYRIAADYDVACRLFKSQGIDSFKYIPITVSYYDTVDDGVSRGDMWNTRKEYCRIKIANRMRPYYLKDYYWYKLLYKLGLRD